MHSSRSWVFASVARQVVDVVGGHERQSQLAADRGDLAVELRLRHAVVGGDALVLDLEVEVARREDARRTSRPTRAPPRARRSSIDLLTMPLMHAMVPMSPSE